MEVGGPNVSANARDVRASNTALQFCGKGRDGKSRFQMSEAKRRSRARTGSRSNAFRISCPTTSFGTTRLPSCATVSFGDRPRIAFQVFSSIVKPSSEASLMARNRRVRSSVNRFSGSAGPIARRKDPQARLSADCMPLHSR